MTYANVAMTLALVLAMTGGAFAAGKFVITSTKQIKPSVLKQFQGKTGPAGPAGPAGGNGKDGAPGAQGPKGDMGSAGKDGVNGANGATGSTGPTGAKGAAGAAGPVGATGPSGSPWVVNAAPKGAILQGTWAIQQYTASKAGELIPAPISTTVPIKSVSIVLVVKPGEDLPGQETFEREEAETICPGTASKPLPSSFPEVVDACVYVQQATNLVPPNPSTGNDLLESGGGLTLGFQSNTSGEAKGYGSWVVTAK